MKLINGGFNYKDTISSCPHGGGEDKAPIGSYLCIKTQINNIYTCNIFDKC